MRALTVTAPAKVNLFLGIGATRADGHHDLVSVFHTLELHDVLRLTPSDNLSVTCDDLADVPPEHNLAYRAFDAAPLPVGEFGRVLEALERGDAEALGAALANNMTAAAASLVPEVGDALAWMRARPGVFGALVAGSGSAVFGICQDARTARRIADVGAADGWWSTATTSREDGVHVGAEGEHS